MISTALIKQGLNFTGKVHKASRLEFALPSVQKDYERNVNNDKCQNKRLHMHSRNALYIPGEKKLKNLRKNCAGAHDISIPADGLAWLSSRYQHSGGIDDSPAQLPRLSSRHIPSFFLPLKLLGLQFTPFFATHSLTLHRPYFVNTGSKDKPK